MIVLFRKKRAKSNHVPAEDIDEPCYFCFLCNKKEPVMNANQLTEHYKLEHPGVRKTYRKIEDFAHLSHVCDICELSFDTIMKADEHINQHENQHTCIHCGEKFKKTLDYAKHLFDHTGIPNCELCAAVFKNKQSMINHYAVHLNSMKPFICDQPGCNRRYTELYLLRDHQERHMDNAIYKCSLCGKSYVTESYLKMHIKNVHPELRTGKVFNYECKMCERKFKFNLALKRHVVNVHYSASQEKFQCEKCARFYSTKEYLNIHLKNVHKQTEHEELTCQICNKIYKGALSLRKHISSTHRKPYKVCEVCGKHVKDIKLHKLKHGEKSFRCEVCQKMFTSRRQLLVHERIHSGKKPYKCKHCGQAFTQAGSRKIHERIHTNERPFICENCGKGFISSGVMRMHKKKCRKSD